ncbi:molecular chaperone [Longilinea arvoryzae]|uniref:Molecular chaperone n=1 Tax=Longilinea arvoryzae TaxID=360412 RepID=A0A0S7BNW8_9CHLR|nr:Hsp20/alpha crystallin family protein [Longilinea arvoryzae]GAP15466.1 molecular chaperone [Longilinea arvoryzae]
MTMYVRNPMSEMLARRMAWNRAMEQWPDVEVRVALPLDVRSEGDDYILTALLPGVKGEDLNVQVINDTITIQGEFKSEDEKSEFLLNEIPTGRFYRELTLPAPPDTGKVEAHLENGVLTLRVPKAEEARPKSIKVVTK